MAATSLSLKMKAMRRARGGTVKLIARVGLRSDVRSITLVATDSDKSSEKRFDLQRESDREVDRAFYCDR